MNNLYTLSLDSIKYILGLIRDTVDLPANILDDLHIQSTTTYSSYRLDTLLKALKEENIQYCDEAISKLNKLSKEIITDKLQITNENTIYLLLTDPVNNVYEQWLLINGTPQMIGTTEMKLDSVYTKNEADDRYALLTDFNTLTTSFNNLVTSVDKKIEELKANFEVGVNTIYNSVVAKGVTPIDKSPSEISNAITNIGGDNISVEFVETKQTIRNDISSNHYTFEDDGIYIVICSATAIVTKDFNYVGSGSILYEKKYGLKYDDTYSCSSMICIVNAKQGDKISHSHVATLFPTIIQRINIL